MTRRTAIGWLLLVSLVWGCTFTLTKQALEWLSPLVFVALRFSLATLLIARAFRGITGPELKAGAVLGVLFWAGFVFQTMGLELTTPSRSAFITSLSSTLVPAVALLVYRIVPGRLVGWAIALATFGMYLLTAPRGGGANPGDLLTLGCAVAFAGHIVAAAHYTRRFAPLRLLACQLGLTAVLSLAAAPLLETPRFSTAAPALGLVAILAAGGLWSFYMQFRAQRHVSASDAALVFMSEPVFATAVSFAVLGERFTPLQWLGGSFILVALAVPVMGERRSERTRRDALHRDLSRFQQGS